MDKNIVVFISVFFVAGLLYYILKPPRDDVNKIPMLQIVRDNFGKLDPSYKSIPLAEGDSSYTENKSAISLCLKDPKTQQIYDENTINYVALHELAHVITKESGKESHGEEFKKNFSTLLKLAEQKGFYDPSLSIPTNYCGIKE